MRELIPMLMSLACIGGATWYALKGDAAMTALLAAYVVFWQNWYLAERKD